MRKHSISLIDRGIVDSLTFLFLVKYRITFLRFNVKSTSLITHSYSCLPFTSVLKYVSIQIIHTYIYILKLIYCLPVSIIIRANKHKTTFPALFIIYVYIYIGDTTEWLTRRTSHLMIASRVGSNSFG
jgi:hypothetical protein